MNAATKRVQRDTMMKPTNRSTLEAVVVGTDFSQEADPALSWAMLIARSHKTVLHLVHAATGTLPFVDRFDPTSMLGGIARDLGRKRLSMLADRLRSPDQPIECHLIHSRASVAILNVANRVRARLIVVGTRGEGGLRHLLMGSTAERVAQLSTGAVLTVSPDCKRATRWPRRVLVAMDFSLEAEAALDAIEGILRLHEGPTEVLLLTVFQTPEGLEQVPEAVGVWRDYVAECRKLLDERMSSLQASIDSPRLSTQVLFREGIPAERIVRVAIEEEVDLIALGSRGTFAAGRAFLGSVSKRVIQTAPCPTLTVPSLLSSRMRHGNRS